MVDRKNLGAIEIENSAYTSVPTDVDYVVSKFSDSHPSIKIEQVGSIGYHNAGWTYREYKVSAASPGAAMEAAAELDAEAMFELRYGKK